MRDQAAVQVPYPVVRGRGAQINPTGRFESIEVVHDAEFNEPRPDKIKTQYLKDNTQSIVTFNDSPDVGFDAGINPYRGCEHGCIYCYARPSHEYLGFSGGLDFETKILIKTEAPRLLRKKLMSKSWTPQSIALSGNTDCYQPVERKLKITRGCLEVLTEFRNPVGIITKNALVTRDIDLLQELAKYNAVRVHISLTTLDESLANVMEPRTAKPHMRLKAVSALREAGIPVGVMMAPIIPGLTDHEIAPLLKAAADAGAQSAHYVILRLPYGNKELFNTWLESHFPDRKNKVLNHLKSMRDGKLNNPQFGRRMRGEGPYSHYIAQTFRRFKKLNGLDQPVTPLSTEHFRIDPEQQLSLFGT